MDQSKEPAESFFEKIDCSKEEFQKIFDEAALNSHNIASIFYASEWNGNANIQGPLISDFDKTLVPPDNLRHWYSIGDDQAYLFSGEYDAKKLRSVFEKPRPLRQGSRIAEIGCSSGRIIRWFNDEAEKGVEVWGIDIDAAAIKWAEQNIGTNINFMVNTTHPHLPFEDRYFDLIYGCSLFTHISELSTAWLLEVKRILSAKGIAIFTFNDTASIKWLKEKYKKTEDMRYHNPKMLLRELKNRDNPNFSKMTINRSPWQQSVWYDQNYLKNLLGRWFNVVEVIDEFSAYQTGYVLTRKP